MLHRRTRTTCHVSIVISIILFYSHPKTQHVVTCCERLHTSANIAQQETTMLAQQCCVLLRAFARAFKQSKHPQHRSAKIDIQGNSKVEIQECNYSLNVACKPRRRLTALCGVVDDRRTTAFASWACTLRYISLPVVVERDVVVVLNVEMVP